MSKEKLVPRLRFKEFNSYDDWKKFELGETVDFFDGKRKPLEASAREPGPYPYYGASGIIDYVKDYIFDEELILLSEDGANIIDRNYRIAFLARGKYWVNNHAHVLRAKKNYDNGFICEALEIINYEKYNTGTAQPKLNQEVCKKIDLIIPELNEQKKIYMFIEKIDKMIDLQQSKVNKVKDIKSAYLSEMFPKEGEKYPEKRIGGFTEPWTAKKLGSLLDYEQPTNYLVKSDSYDDSYLTPVLTAGKSFLLGYTNETEGIYKADNNNGVIIFDDFTTSSHFVDFDFKVKSSAMKFLRTNQSNFNLYFLYNLLTSINYSPESHERHWISIFSEFEVLVPTKKEQQKIAQLFKNLDNQISIEEEKLAKLEKLKQAYLNDMFI